MGPFGQIYRDYRRYRATGGSWVLTLFFTQGFWASAVYRVNRWAVQRLRFRPLRLVAQVFLSPLSKLTEIVTGICIPASADIGEGLYIGHFGGIFLPSRGRLGRNCSVSQGVTIGQAGTGDKRGAPTIGDRVYIGPHAIVVGKITVGDDAAVCAGAVVTRSVPARAVVAGNPARVISYDGSFDYVSYDGMESDPPRIMSLSAAGPQATADASPGQVPQGIG